MQTMSRNVPLPTADAAFSGPRRGAPRGDERRHGDRRRHVLRALLHGSLRPRRRGPRRAGEHAVASVDWHHPQWLFVGLLIVFGSCADALLTLVLIDHGAYEANPFMVPLVKGSSALFTLVKVALTGGGVLLLTQVARRRAFGGIPVGALLYAVLAFYGALLYYEWQLLNTL